MKVGGIDVSFLSTLSLRRATLDVTIIGRTWDISIHALLAESDRWSFSPRRLPLGFLSTLSLRRATAYENTKAGVIMDFYPRSPCGERLSGDVLLSCFVNFYPRSPCGERLNDAINGCNPDFISIHALLAESDQFRTKAKDKSHHFYPRSPCGERPVQIVIIVMHTLISIHALLAESDQGESSKKKGRANFYPRSPCGERQPTAAGNDKDNIFLSTLSLRRATHPAPED